MTEQARGRRLDEQRTSASYSRHRGRGRGVELLPETDEHGVKRATSIQETRHLVDATRVRWPTLTIQSIRQSSREKTNI
jgi:hypothetical protein